MKLEVPADLPTITCRSQQIMQVLMNLIINARDSLNERYEGWDANKQITISCKMLEKDERPWIRTTVMDCGAGVAPEIAEQRLDVLVTKSHRRAFTILWQSPSLAP